MGIFSPSDACNSPQHTKPKEGLSARILREIDVSDPNAATNSHFRKVTVAAARHQVAAVQGAPHSHCILSCLTAGWEITDT